MENHPFLWRRIRRVRRIQVCMARKGLSNVQDGVSIKLINDYLPGNPTKLCNSSWRGVKCSNERALCWFFPFICFLSRFCCHHNLSWQSIKNEERSWSALAMLRNRLSPAEHNLDEGQWQLNFRYRSRWLQVWLVGRKPHHSQSVNRWLRQIYLHSRKPTQQRYKIFGCYCGG